MVGAAVGCFDGLGVGWPAEYVGDMVGESVGASVGELLGFGVGLDLTFLDLMPVIGFTSSVRTSP